MAIARAKQDAFRERVWVSYDHASISADTTVKLWTAPQAMRVNKVWYNNPTGLAEDATNAFNLKLLKGATVVANWDTDSDVAGTNTIAADTPFYLTLSATDTDRVFAAGDVMSMFFDESGTATLPAGRFMIECELL